MFLWRFIFYLGTLTLVVTGNPTWEPEVQIQKANELGSSTKEFPITDHVSSRDTYVNAAADYGYAQQHQQQQLQPSVNQYDSGGGNHGQDTGSGHFGPPSAYEYTIYPNQGGGSHSNNYYAVASSHKTSLEESSGGWLCRTFGGICDEGLDRQGNETLGIIALVALGLKKLKLVKLAPFLPLAIPFLPILFPILLIILIPVLIAAWFLPVVPVLVIGRALSSSAVKNVRETLLSEDCLERITCEAFKVSRGFGFEAPWIQQFLNKASSRSKWIEKMARAGRSTTGCDSYTCRPVAALQRSLKIN